MEQSVIRDRCRSTLRIFPALNMDRPKRYIVLLRGLIQNRHVFSIKRALAGVVQNIPFFIYMRVLRAFLELRFVCVIVKRQIPQLYPVIRLVTNSKSLVFEELGIRQEGFLLRRSQNTQAFPSLFPAVLDAGIQQIGRISVSLERAGHPQAVDVHIPFRIDRNPGVLRRDILDKTLAPLHTLQENKSFLKSVGKPRLL